jgi:TolA-binding protein
MAPCAETNTGMSALRKLLLATTVGFVLAGCAQKAPKPERPVKPAGPDATQPADPAKPPADKGDPEGRFTEALDLMKQKKTAEAEAAFMALTRDFPEFSGPQA